MSASRRVPAIRLVHIAHSSNWRVRHGGYSSLDHADEEVSRAFVGGIREGTTETISVRLAWDDGHAIEEHLRLGPEHLAAADAADVGILRYLLLASARHAAAGSPGADLAPFVIEQRMIIGRELLRRLVADGAALRNASGPPRVVRVVLSIIKGRKDLHRAAFDSIANADARLSADFTSLPSPAEEQLGWVGGVVYWSDHEETHVRFYVTHEHLLNAQADGGILRHALLRDARLEAAPTSYPGHSRDIVKRRTALGRAMLARLEADARDDDAHRNTATSRWATPTLLPDPAEAIRRLRDRFAGRREIVRAIGEWDGDERAAYPATNRADVRYVVNYISFALRNDVATLPATAGAVVWNHWTGVRDTIETLLRGGDDNDRYEDNEGLWVRQLPALVRLLNEAREDGSPLRNGRLTFRPVGGRGDAYPPWVADLRGRSGVYVIRAPGESGDLEIVYVGSSSADRLHETLTRHFQQWRRWKGFWRGQYGEGHDPGLTYDRATAEAAVIITPSQHAYELEMRLIRRLRPRDNLLGQDVAHEEVPF
ncbi:MAG: GIY-YIG nuclease family protein [Kofleriaceae bacterium]|nr:MAG: GIY-YIG nuclease family protein [Kofleriaceae bacterium]